MSFFEALVSAYEAIEEARKEREMKERVNAGGIFGALIGGVIGGLCGGVELAAYFGFIGACIGIFYATCGCAGCIGTIVFVGIITAALFITGVITGVGENKDNNVDEVPKEENAPKKETSYLDAIKNIESLDEAKTFCYKISEDYSNNKMGLKGDAEQIAAGNRLMSGVYDFLAASTTEDLNVDSLKNEINNNEEVSDFRKKKAVSELNQVLKKIKSLQ